MADICTASSKKAFSKTTSGHNRQTRSNNVNNIAISDKESSLFSSDLDDNDKKDLNNFRNNADKWGQNVVFDLEESEVEQEALFTEDEENQPCNPASCDRGSTGGPADPITAKRPSDERSNDHNLWAFEEPTAHTAPNEAQQFDTDRVDESIVVEIVQGLKTFISKEMCMSIIRILEEERKDKEHVRKLWKELTLETLVITTTSCSLFVKQPATEPLAKEI